MDISKLTIDKAAEERVRRNLHLNKTENILELCRRIAETQNVKVIESGKRLCIHEGHVLFILDRNDFSIISAQYIL